MERSYTPSGIFLIVHRCQIDGCKQNSSRFTIQDSNEIGAKILSADSRHWTAHRSVWRGRRM